MFDISPLPARSTIQATELIHIVIADGQRLFREALAHLLSREADLAVIGLASTITEVLESILPLRPDILVLDGFLPLALEAPATSSEQTLSLIKQLKAEYPDIRILLLLPATGSFSLVEALSIGAHGYLFKETSAQGFVAALRAIWAGEQVLAPELMPRLLSQLHSPVTLPGQELTELTAREHELFLLVARGMVAKEIARFLSISEKTVRNHLSTIYRKLNLYDRSQIVLYAIKHGLINPQQEGGN